MIPTTHQKEPGNITFRPASGGWYICNQNSKIRVKNPKKFIIAFRKQQYATAHPEVFHTTENNQYPRTTLRNSGKWKCPGCGQLSYGYGRGGSIVVCSNSDCRKKYYLLRK